MVRRAGTQREQDQGITRNWVNYCTTMQTCTRERISCCCVIVIIIWFIVLGEWSACCRSTGCWLYKSASGWNSLVLRKRDHWLISSARSHHQQCVPSIPTAHWLYPITTGTFYIFAYL